MLRPQPRHFGCRTPDGERRPRRGRARDQRRIFVAATLEQHAPGLYRAVCTLPGNFLNEGRYYVTVYVVTLGPLVVEVDAPQVIEFNVFDTGVMREAGGGGYWAGVVRVRLPWRTQMLQLPEPETEVKA